MKYLRKRDVVEALGVPKSTVSDWMNEFSAYIPVVREGSVTFYRPETVDVLLAIQELRLKGHAKSEIVSLLADRKFAINENQAISIASQDTPTQMLATLSLAMGRLADQGGRIEALEREIAELRLELAAAKETRQRKWWQFRI